MIDKKQFQYIWNVIYEMFQKGEDINKIKFVLSEKISPYMEINENNKKMLFIPKGFAHGFLTLEDNTEIFYKCDNFYEPKSEAGIIWNDKDLNIDWNLEKYNIKESELIISEKDKKNTSFKEYKKINDIE